ncbi:MAG: SIS domain-containing protein [Candidatus Faecousia sp.]|nr:SIS domain-containing protein [Candidatus Faecousia sp.]
MFLTEAEILDTPAALERTCGYFSERQADLSEFFETYPKRKFVFLGCGSSFMLAKSAAALFSAFPGTGAFAIPAGDYIVSPEFWLETVRGSVVVSISRSGRTSEMVRAVRHMKQSCGCPVISLSMEAGNDIAPMSNLDLTMDWCYDRSVCQTRTVTNLYTAVLLLGAAYAHDGLLAEAVREASRCSGGFQRENRGILEAVADLDWKNVTVLADGPLCGIAEEAALAFTEIALMTGRYFHILDYRHGPVVVSGPDTLTLMLLSPAEDTLQGGLVRDVKAHGGPVVTVSRHKENVFGSTAHIPMPEIRSFAAWGILFIYVAQMLALKKSINLGGNPDAPKGLDAYITLK